MNMEFLSQPFATRRLGDHLRDELASARWAEFLAAVAFAKRSGTVHVVSGLHSFARRGRVRMSVGLDHGGTSLEGVEDLWGALDGHGELYAVHHTRASGDRVHHTFHPKVFLFQNASEALLIVGSGNLTQGGLYGNYEAGVVFALDLVDDAQRTFRDSAVRALDEWADPASGLCTLVDRAALQRLFSEGLLPREALMGPRARAGGATSGSGGAAAPLFAPSLIPPAPPSPPTAPVLIRPVSSELPPPSRPGRPVRRRRRTGVVVPTGAPVAAVHRVLYIEAIPHHNGEVFLSKLALRDDPVFFGHPFTGLTVPKRSGNPAYPMRDPDPVVDIVVYDDTDAPMRAVSSHPLNMVEYERKGEIRITVPERMQDLIPAMALLVMTAGDPTSGLDYTLDFYPPGSPGYGTYSSGLSTAMPSGGRPGPGRRYGWA